MAWNVSESDSKGSDLLWQMAQIGHVMRARAALAGPLTSSPSVGNICIVRGCSLQCCPGCGHVGIPLHVVTNEVCCMASQASSDFLCCPPGHPSSEPQTPCLLSLADRSFDYFVHELRTASSQTMTWRHY